MTPDELLKSLQWRYATKTFDPNKKISNDLWQTIEESMVLTPSSFGLQPWKFITISNAQTKEALLEHSWNQAQVTDCSHMVVLCAKQSISEDDIEHWLTQITKTRQVERSSLDVYAGMMHGFFSSMNNEAVAAWAKNQVYIALGQLMTTASVLGVDACPMEGILPPEYDKILDLEGTDYRTSVACAMGYRSEKDHHATLPKVRYAKDGMITFLP